MYAIDVDLADDRFDVTFDADRVSTDDLLRAIRALDYEPELVEAPGGVAAAAESVDPATLPEGLRDLLARAASEGKPVLVEFTGPG